MTGIGVNWPDGTLMKMASKPVCHSVQELRCCHNRKGHLFEVMLWYTHSYAHIGAPKHIPIHALTGVRNVLTGDVDTQAHMGG